MKDDVEGKKVPKDEKEWVVEEEALSTYNSRSINAIFNGMDPIQFKMILQVEVVKEA